MKKILSFFAAMLVAGAVFATPVVLPATLDVSNVSFRSEGMPDFVLEEGDYAGTYFDMGAHDSSNDTLLYAEWDVTIEPIKYNIAVDVYNTNSWRVQLYLLNQAGDTLKSLRYKGSSGQCGQFAIGAMDLSDLAAGDYKVRARAATAWSAMKLKDVIFEADYQGVNVNLPGTLLPAYAELSSGASVANHAIAFNPGTAPEEYAKWNVTFANAGEFNVSIDYTATNGHTYGVALLSADGQTEINAVAEAQAWDTGVKDLGAITVPAAGKYIVKLTNATQWSEAVLNSITFAAPAPAHTYTVAGSSTDLFGTAWSPANEANDMALQDDGTYKWEKTELTLAAGSIEFKVCEDHGWDKCWPSQNYVLNIAEAGIYTITITFEPANENKVDAVATKTGSAEVLPTIAMHGNFLGSWADTKNFTEAEDKATASLKLTIAAGNYEFGMRIGGAGNWTSNGAAFTRENNSAKIEAGSGNLTLAADVEGEYTFTWTYETSTLAITFPEAHVIDEWVKIIFTEAVAADDLAEEASFTILGSEFALTIHDAGNKMAIDANDCRFGTADDYTMYNFRIKSGGASSSTKNYFTLNIPEAGKLRLAPRTGSNSATDRALVIAQGETELYNAIVQESQAIEVQEGEATVKVYPYVEVPVVAGEVRVSYTAGMNFYAFAFKAAEPQPEVPSIALIGGMNDWDGNKGQFVVADDYLSASLTLNLAEMPQDAGYAFKLLVDGIAMGSERDTQGNPFTFTRENNILSPVDHVAVGDDEIFWLFMDVTGDYTFTYTFADNSLAITYPALAPVEHSYTVAGSSAVAFGTAWDPTNTANDMAKQDDGSYKWEKANLELPAGTIEFKVCQDHDWATCWPAQNYALNVSEAATYTLTITFNPANENVGAELTKTGSAEIDPAASAKGSWDGWAAEVVFVLADNKETASGALNLEPGDYEFKVILNGGDWRSNGYSYHREFTGAEGITGNGDNMVLKADVAGEYTLTWTFATNALNITFPVASGIDNTNDAVKAQKMIINGQLFIIRNGEKFNVQGQIVR